MPSSRELCQAALLLSDALWLLMEQRKSKLQVALPCLVCRAFTTVHGLGHIPVILALRRLGQKDYGCKGTLGYIVSSLLCISVKRHRDYSFRG